MNHLYPVFLDLRERPCLVVGAGGVARRKIESLLDARARVTVVAPAATGAVRALHDDGRVTLHLRAFAPDDLAGAALVVAATNDGSVNGRVHGEARRRGVPCNVVDVPALCDFHVPAVVTRGDLKIAVSTAGRAPAFAARLRRELEARFGEAYGEAVRVLGALRDALRDDAALSEPERKAILTRAAASPVLDDFLEGRSARLDAEGLR